MEPVASHNIPFFQFRFLYDMIVSHNRIEIFLARQGVENIWKEVFCEIVLKWTWNLRKMLEGF